MAIKKSSATKATAPANGQKRADGFLNVSVVDAQGNTHKLSVGIPLDIQRKLDRSLINAASANADREFQLVGTVWIAPDESEQNEDIPF